MRRLLEQVQSLKVRAREGYRATYRSTAFYTPSYLHSMRITHSLRLLPNLMLSLLHRISSPVLARASTSRLTEAPNGGKRSSTVTYYKKIQRWLFVKSAFSSARKDSPVTLFVSKRGRRFNRTHQHACRMLQERAPCWLRQSVLCFVSMTIVSWFRFCMPWNTYQNETPRFL